MHTNVRFLIQYEKAYLDSKWKDDFVQLFDNINVEIWATRIETLVEESDLVVFDLNIGDNIASIVNIDIAKDRIVSSLLPIEISESMIRFIVHISTILKLMYHKRRIRKASIFADTFLAICVPIHGGKSFNFNVTKDQQAKGRLSHTLESKSFDV